MWSAKAAAPRIEIPVMFIPMSLPRFRTLLTPALALVLAGIAFANTAVQPVIRHERAS